MARRKSESKDNTDKRCSDCDHNRSVICDLCQNMNKYDSTGKKADLYEQPADTPENRAALDAVDKCKNHGQETERKGDILFCKECGVSCGIAPPAEVPKSDLESAKECTRDDCVSYLKSGECHGCDDGSKYSSQLATAPVEEVAPGTDRQVTKEETVIEIPPNASPELVAESFEKAADAVAPPAPVEEGDWATFHDPAAEPNDVVMEEEGQGEPKHEEIIWKGGPLDTIDNVPWNVAVLKARDGKVVYLLPGEYQWDDGVVTEIHHLIKLSHVPENATVLEVMHLMEDLDDEADDPEYVNAQEKVAEAEGEKKQPYGQQMKFDEATGGMKPAPVATILHKPRAVPVEIKLNNNQFKLNTTEEGLDNISEKSRSDIRDWVVPRLKVLKDATIRRGDYDAAVDLMVQIVLGEVEVEEVWKDNIKQASPAVKGEA